MADETDLPSESSNDVAGEATETEATETTAPTESLFQDLRGLADRAKHQWSAALARARTRIEPEAGEDEVRPTLLKRAREQGRALLSSEPVSRAQHRGAGLLLDVVSRARQGIERLETNLREIAAPAPEEPAAA